MWQKVYNWLDISMQHSHHPTQHFTEIQTEHEGQKNKEAATYLGYVAREEQDCFRRIGGKYKF